MKTRKNPTLLEEKYFALLINVRKQNFGQDFGQSDISDLEGSKKETFSLAKWGFLGVFMGFHGFLGFFKNTDFNF